MIDLSTIYLRAWPVAVRRWRRGDCDSRLVTHLRESWLRSVGIL
jgi:hypothetical protein